MNVRQIALGDIVVADRHRKDMGDLETLAASIKRLGLLQPIGLRADKRLVWGHRRLEAFRLLGRKQIPAIIIADGDELHREAHENTKRLDFSPMEAVIIGRDLEVHEAALAKQRMSEGGKVGKISTPSEVGKTRDKVAATAGISGRTYEKAKAVVQAAEQEPERFADLLAEMEESRSVNSAFRKLNQRRDEHRILSLRPIVGKFKTLVVDPPWDYEWLSIAGRAAPGYGVMSHDDLRALPVPSWAEDDCHLYLWTTNNFMTRAVDLMQAWGFAHKTVLTWAKPRWGLGSYFRNQTEHVLFGIRGELGTRRDDISTLFEGPMGDHSEKPESFYEIVRAASYPPYGEAFQRLVRPDFTNLYAMAEAA